MAKVLQMHADLMRAAGVQGALHQRADRQHLHHAPRRPRGAAALAGDHGHLLALDRMPPDGRLDHPSLLRKITASQGQVDLGHRAAGKLPREVLVGGVVFRDEQAPARILVEPVHDARPVLAADGGEITAVREQRIDHRA